jgi:hypothetical protein
MRPPSLLLPLLNEKSNVASSNDNVATTAGLRFRY